MITLYYSPGSAAMVVHWLLLELDVPHTLHEIDLDAGEQKQPAYLAINPAGVVPTLVVDGQPLTEAAAIAMYLTDVHAARGLAPAPGTLARGAYYQWMVFFANTLQTAFRAWFYPHEPVGGADLEAVKSQARLRIEAAWERIDTHLAANGPYVLGDQLTTADFMLTMLMRWSRNMPAPATEWPALARLAATMKARPTFRELYALEGLTEWS